jgi:hypothetical protein
VEYVSGRERQASMEAAMDLMRRMPPSLSQQALDSLLALLPAQSSELLSRSDQPLQVPRSLVICNLANYESTFVLLFTCL